MQKIIIPILSISLLSSIIYASHIETNPEIIIEKQNREDILECLEDVYTQTGTTDMIRKIKKCESIPLRSITGTGKLTPVSEPPSIEVVKLNDCMSKYNHKKVCTEYAQGLRTNNIKSEIETEELGKLHDKVCRKQINSPLCKDRALFDRLYHITEERLPGKQFFPILLGMTNSESSLGLDMAKDNIGGYCHGRNNWGGAKYQIKDDNTRKYERELNGFVYKYPRDQYNCNLYPFESIEEYWTSKVNGIRYGYKHCIDSKTPLACISVHYVGSEKVVKPQWVKNASIFLD